MGKLDSAVVNVIIDEIMRAAVDGGIGSTRCEIMAEVLSTMCSKNSRGRILSKLRKVGLVLHARLKIMLNAIIIRLWVRHQRSQAKLLTKMCIGTKLLLILV